MKIDSFREENFYLSNFFPCTVYYDGITYQNAEAAFQAQKCLEKPKRMEFADLDATSAKKLGRSVSLRPDWEAQKVRIMKEVVDAKFSQNPSLQNQLVATGEVLLEEGNTWGDRTWGTVNGNGANLLGNILMELREKYKRQELKENDVAENEINQKHGKKVSRQREPKL